MFQKNLNEQKVSNPPPPTGTSGLLNIYKPSGVTSGHIVRKISSIMKTKKVGHCGTLDPLAEGVLLILFGSSTKKQSFFMQKKKTYAVRMLLGVVTESGDITGKVLEEKPVPAFSASRVHEILSLFMGEIIQTAPAYSSVHYQGRRLYEHARDGVLIKHIPRQVTIYRIELVSHSEKHIECIVECSSGTYIRTLVEDIGAQLGCGATVAYLCRQSVGEYTIDSALRAPQLEACTSDELLKQSMVV